MSAALRRLGPGLGLVLGLALLACEDTVTVEPAPGQILLFFDTDAPVPSVSSRAASIVRPTPLFDRVRIELFAPGASEPCESCINEFELEEGVLRASTASVGIAPPPGKAGYRARVRMFLAALARDDGTPDPDATVEVTVALPTVAQTGKKEVTVFLSTETVGTPTGSLEEPAAPIEGRPTASQVGTWPGAARVPCASEPRQGEVCVPGGAYWMGGPSGPWAILPARDGLRPRLVVVSPFFVDATEVTVAAYRGTSSLLVYWSGSASGDDLADFCTNTPRPDARERFPANCVTWAQARKHCQSRGADLLSEAQWEYAAGGMLGRTFVWGEDNPRCEDAVFSRLGHGIFKNSVSTCTPPAPPGGPEAVGSGARDRFELPTGTIVDLAGNVIEWVVDAWGRADEECWGRPGVYVDPVCAVMSSRDGKLRAARGGEWRIPGAQLSRRLRGGSPAGTVSPEVGFRCARKAHP